MNAREKKPHLFLHTQTGDKNEVALHDWPCYIIARLVSFRMREWHAPASDVFCLKPSVS